MLVQDLVHAIDDRIDLTRAAPWDRVGLQIGTPHAPLGQVGVCHELTPDAVETVISDGIDTVIAYHPLLFTPTTEFVDGPTASGRGLRLAVAGVSVIVVHTAFDAAPGGTADALAEAVGVENPKGFGCEDDDPRRCIGRVGHIEPLTIETLSTRISTTLGTTVRTSGDPARTVEIVAVVPGSGASFIPEAFAADVLVTGDVKHHEAVMAAENGLSIIDAGHIPTERPGFDALYDVVVEMTPDARRIGTDPYPWKD